MDLASFGPQPRNGACFVGFDVNPVQNTTETIDKVEVSEISNINKVEKISTNKKMSDIDNKPRWKQTEKEKEYTNLIRDYRRDGYVVVSGVLSPQQVEECRKGFHEDLKKMGVDHKNLKGCIEALRKVQTHPSGGMPFHYSPWRIKNCALNKKLFEVTIALWKETWAISAPGYVCPYAPFDPNVGFAFVDSLNFRLPSTLVVNNVQRTIGPHIDINPWDNWGGRKGKIRWRPFQGFISLTDNTGGFECCPGFHLEIDEYFKNIPKPPNYNKGYINLQSSVYSDIHSRMRPVKYQPGDAVLWDWRLAHRIAEHHVGSDTREVVYTSFLPNISINRNYVQKQLAAFRKGMYPPDFTNESNEKKTVPCWEPSLLDYLTDPFDKKLLGISNWY